ncbi:MAG TPA: M12 family metallo-peptidase, partial [Phnomibacter sp.]|nr:M12 family metallo-peptidase [Phnomibacter sp.]
MRSIIRIATGLLLLVVQSVYAQPKTPVSERVQEARSKGRAFSAPGLMKRLGDPEPQMQRVLKRGSLMAIDKRIMAELRSKKPDHVMFEIPIDASQTITLELVKNEVLTNDFRVTSSVPTAERYQRDRSVHYQGIVHGPARSLAAISIVDDEMVGVIDVDGIGNMILGALENDPMGRYAFFRSDDLQHDLTFECGADVLSPAVAEVADQITVMNTDPNRCVRIYFECDYDTYLARGSSVTNTVNYITSVYNVVKTLYDNESVRTAISEIFVWNTEDGYPTTSTADALLAFQSKRQANYNGDVAHLISSGAPTGGGMAFLDVLCSKSSSFAYSYISQSFNQFPTYSWTVMVITHEMGHTLGSPHTHRCAWDVDGDGVAGEMIDGCAASLGISEGGTCTTAPIPSTGGTIMSYCHVASVGINFNNGFGPLPGARIRNRVYNATCLSVCSGGGGTTCQTTVSVTGTNVTCPGGNNGSATAQPAGGTPPYTYLWSNGATTATINGLTPGTYSVTVKDNSSGGCPVSGSITVTAPSAWNVTQTITQESLPGAGNGAINITVSGATAPYTYQWTNGSTNEDLVNIAAGSYSVTIRDSRGCTTSRNFTVGTGSCGQQITTFPVAESFESGTGIFTQATNDNYDWIRQTGPTPNNNTGPAGAYQGSWYLFAQGKGNSGNANLESPCLDLRNVASPLVRFAYSMNGTQVGTLRLEVSTDNGGNWIQLWSRTGNQGTGTGWATESVPLSSYKTAFTRIRFVAVAGGNFGDIGIDDIKLENDAPTCTAPALSFTKNDVNCFGGSNGSATVSASNGTTPYAYLWSNGATTATISNLTAGTYQVTVTANGGCSSTGSVIITQPSAISAQAQAATTSGPGAGDGSVTLTVSGGTAPYTYTWSTGATTKDLLNVKAGTYTVEIRDARSCTFTTTATVADGAGTGNSCTNGITLPHIESFENGHVHWVQSAADQFDWRKNSGGTPTSNTGPSAAADGQFYMYTESNDASSGARAILESSCLNLTNISNANFQFSWHMFGNQMGSLDLQISDNNGSTWQQLWGRRGSNGNSWVTQTISLSAYVGKVVRFRFVGTLSNGVRGDMAIDNIRITSVGGAIQNSLITNVGGDRFDWQKIYPNPTSGQVQLEVHVTETTMARVSLIDATGRTSDMGPLLLNSGMNTVRLNLPTRHAGMYML